MGTTPGVLGHELADHRVLVGHHVLADHEGGHVLAGHVALVGAYLLVQVCLLVRLPKHCLLTEACQHCLLARDCQVDPEFGIKLFEI